MYVYIWKFIPQGKQVYKRQCYHLLQYIYAKLPYEGLAFNFSDTFGGKMLFFGGIE